MRTYRDFLNEDGVFEVPTNRDLSRANLRGANLSEANLRGANLSEANLSGSDLSRANLRGANLSGSDLSGSDLSRANLRGANLSGSDLSGADLSGADLRLANLSQCTGLLDVDDWLTSHFKRNAAGNWLVYKSFGTYYNSPPVWQIEADAILTEVVNPNPTDDCGCGINFATLDWYRHDEIVWECEIISSQIVVPYNTDGKARTAKVRLIRQATVAEFLAERAQEGK